MPLVRLEVRNEYGLGDPELYRVGSREDSKAVLDGVAVAGLVGILRQLGDIAEFASDIFHNLHEQLMITSSRGQKLLAQVKQLEMELPNVENAIQDQRSCIHFSYKPGSDWHSDLKVKSHLFSSDLPQFMMDSYEECREPPRFYLLDKFDSAGTGSCLKRYSDPSYFKREWGTLELKKAEKLQRQKKTQKIKRKGSQIKSREGIPLWQRHSSTQFASPSTDELHNSTGTTPISDMNVKLELASRSASFGSRTRMNYVEQVPDTNSSGVLDELENDRLCVPKLQINQRGSFASDVHDKLNGVSTLDGSPHCLLKAETSHVSPSVKWDEKIEILKSTSPRSCNDIPVDGTGYLEPLQASSEQSKMELEISIVETIDKGNSIFCTANVQTQTPVSSVNHFEEVNSEIDKYIDALNTLESEMETDTECQTKREIKSMSNCNNPPMESRISQPQELASSCSDASGINTASSSHSSSNENNFPNTYNLVTSESLKLVQSSQSVGSIPDPYYQIGNQISEHNSYDISRINIPEGGQDDRPPELSISGSPTILGPKTISNVSRSPDSPCVNFSPPVNFSNVPSPRFWTNGGLLGLEPSKPPVFSESKVSSEGFVSDSGNLVNEHSSSLERIKLHNNELTTEQKTLSTSNETASRSYSFIRKTDGLLKASLNGHQRSSTRLDNRPDSIPANQNSETYSLGLSSGEFEQIKGVHHSNISAQNGCHNSVPRGVELPSSNTIESQPNGPGPNTTDIKASLSALAQRILANSLQRKPLIAQAQSENANADSNKQQETSLLSNQKEEPTEVVSKACYAENTNNAESISSKISISSSPHLAGQSSPPLEHMKISFHPMNGPEISKLNLEYSSINFHDNIEDLTFPSFQLLPGPNVPLEYKGSETDDDTFCGSCPCSSEDHLSPHSDSSSEPLGQDDLSEGQNNDIYKGLHGVSLSSPSVFSFDRFGQMCQIEATKNSEAESSILYFQNGNSVCLPGLDSVTHAHHRGVCEFFNPESFSCQSQSELAPPPPLPPLQWRVKEVSFGKDEKKDSSVAEIVEHFSVLQTQRLTAHQQQELNVPRPPLFAETMSFPITKSHDGQKHNREEIKSNDFNGEQKHGKNELLHQILKKNDEQKLNGHKERTIPCANGQEVDEREELLDQIRNKSFNLRPTSTAKPRLVSQPTTNTNVAAILEKANAICQAFVAATMGVMMIIGVMAKALILAETSIHELPPHLDQVFVRFVNINGVSCNYGSQALFYIFLRVYLSFYSIWGKKYLHVT